MCWAKEEYACRLLAEMDFLRCNLYNKYIFRQAEIQ